MLALLSFVLFILVQQRCIH